MVPSHYAMWLDLTFPTLLCRRAADASLTLSYLLLHISFADCGHPNLHHVAHSTHTLSTNDAFVGLFKHLRIRYN